jgi:hypothetical protein
MTKRAEKGDQRKLMIFGKECSDEFIGKVNGEF